MGNENSGWSGPRTNADPDSAGGQLALIRVANGWTQAHFAELLREHGLVHVYQGDVSEWECGIKEVPPEVFEVINNMLQA